MYGTIPRLPVGNIVRDIADVTAEDAAKNLQRMGADAFVALEAGDLPGTDVVLFDEGILRDALFPHHAPQLFV